MNTFLGKAGVALAVGGILGAGTAAGFGIASAVSPPRPHTVAGAGSPATAGDPLAFAPADLGPATTGTRVGPGLRRLLAHRVEHGEVTVKGKDGKPVVVDVQRGQVTAVSATSITLKSEDGFTASYTVTSDSRVRVKGDRKAIGDVRVGNNAGLIATKVGSTATARLVVVR